MQRVMKKLEVKKTVSRSESGVIAVLIKREEDKTSYGIQILHSKGKTAEKKSVSETEKTDIVTSDAEKEKKCRQE